MQMSHQINRCLVRRMILMATVMSATFVILRDIAAYKNGGQPWFAVVDSFCGMFFHANRNTLIAEIPVRGDRMTMRISHPWRGKYQLRLRVPNNVDVNEKIGLKCTFQDQMGNSLFEQAFSHEVHAAWYPMPRGDGKYRAFWMYSVPQNVPLDEVVTVEIRLVGDVDAFLKYHPESELLLVKERDK